MLKTLVMNFLVFKPQFSRRLSRIFFSASSRLSRNFRGRLVGLAQIAAGGRLSRRLRGLAQATVGKGLAQGPYMAAMLCYVRWLFVKLELERESNLRPSG